ncbi:MAG: chromosome segregation protein SMC, partial [Dokdonella sp.]
DSDHGTLRVTLERSAGEVDQRRALFEQNVERESALQQTLSSERSELEQARGRLASLEALQQGALGESGEAARQWLDKLGLSTARRLGEVLRVDAGWEAAVETVLDGWLEAVLVPVPEQLAGELGELRDADLGLLAQNTDATFDATGTLAAHTTGPAAARALLSKVRTAANLAEARSLLGQLSPDESVICPSGEWLGHGFARVQRGSDAQVGVLAREREIEFLRERVAKLNENVDTNTTQLEHARGARVEAERERDERQRELYEQQRRLADLGGQLQHRRGQHDAAGERLTRIGQEITALVEQLDGSRSQISEARGRLDVAVERMGELEQTRQRLDSERRQLLEAREEARMSAREARERAHELALAIEAKRSALASLGQALQRMQVQIAQLATRRDEIVAQLEAGRDPVGALDGERQTYLNQRLLVDKRMIEARKALEERDAALRELEHERQRHEHNLGEQRDQISELRLAEQENRLRAQALSKAISDAGFAIDEVLAALPEAGDAAQWQATLDDLGHKIARLEPVNLAAIQEYEEQSQRKTYLDAQLADLTTALETLEGAIRKIDKETRQRFRDTFDQVNAGIQELFPRLFGGGQAFLELTGDDLLSTGVAIMARPPGKRISSISLLSGGEKALTAVALVFAIFRLNPAPFCLLDEVDAPLDEANVGRFSSLVRDMSERVQFVFVTHNKGTMDAASQLCGVTMREPGVSRLVQVDLEEAAKLAGVA